MPGPITRHINTLRLHRQVSRIESGEYMLIGGQTMSSHVDTELQSCVAQFHELRTRYLDLKKTQREDAKKKAEKRTSTEPNMVVMETWLRKFRENEELCIQQQGADGAFMREFVEATYNMFNLQNKRIDELLALLVEGGEA